MNSASPTEQPAAGRVCYELTAEDLLAYGEFIYSRRENRNGGKFGLIALMLLATASMGWLVRDIVRSNAAKGGSLPVVLLLIFCIPFLVMAGVALYMVWRHTEAGARWYGRRQMRRAAKSRLPQETICLGLTTAGVEVSGDGAECRVAWRLISAVVQTDDHLFLCLEQQGQMTAYTVPRHAFADAAAFETFCTLATELKPDSTIGERGQ